MVLFSIEYEVVSNGMTFKCDVVGVNEQDVIKSLTSQVGVIKVISLYRKSGVDRITQGIRNKIIDGKNTPTKKKMGRPRLPDE
jgi:hypothetical protein